MNSFRSFVLAKQKLGKLDFVFTISFVFVIFLFCLQALSGVNGSFYQTEFGPALSLACGYDFQNPMNNESVLAFLRNQTHTFHCDELKETYWSNPNPFQLSSYYLIATVAAFWKIFGFSWAVIYWLAYFLAALTAGLTYLLSRLYLSPLISIAIALLFFDFYFIYVVHLRDFSKTPFLISSIFFILWSFRYNSIQRLCFVGFVTGVFCGYGFGFRSDILLAIPALLISQCVYVAWHRSWRNVVGRLCVLSSFIIPFVLFLAPLSSGASNLFHVFILGFADVFTPILGVKGGMQILDLYLDEKVQFLLQLNGFYSNLPMAWIGDGRYDELGSAFYFSILKHLPADIFVRTIAASVAVLSGFSHNILVFWISLCSIGIICCRAKRPLQTAFVISLAIWYLSAIASLQFHPRHSFYLYFVHLLLIGYGIQKIFSWFIARIGSKAKISLLFSAWASQFIRFLNVSLGPLALAVLFWNMLILLQNYQLKSLSNRLADLSLIDIDFKIQTKKFGLSQIAIDADNKQNLMRDQFGNNAGMFVLKFDENKCSHTQIEVGIPKIFATEQLDIWSLPLMGETKFFFPMSTREDKFELTLPTSMEACLTKVMLNKKQPFPLLATQSVVNTNQLLRPTEKAAQISALPKLGFLDTGKLNSLEKIEKFTGLNLPQNIGLSDKALEKYDSQTGVEGLINRDDNNIVHQKNKITFSSVPKSKFSYIFKAIPPKLKDKYDFIVKLDGELMAGNIGVGILGGGQWVWQSGAVQKGQLKIALRVLNSQEIVIFARQNAREEKISFIFEEPKWYIDVD